MNQGLPIKMLIGLAGLSLQNAADFLGVHRQTVSSWTCGRNGTPTWAMHRLRHLCKMQQVEADMLAERTARDSSDGGIPKVFLSRADKEQLDGAVFCPGGHRAIISRAIVILGDDVQIHDCKAE